MYSKTEIELILETGSLNLDLFWLRDHCRCELCYDHANHQRKIGILDIPDDIGTKSYTIDGDNVLVVCKKILYFMLKS